MLNVSVSRDLQRKIEVYRQQRRSETGKVIQSSTAIRELLEKALEGVEPPKPLEDRIEELKSRLSKLEEKFRPAVVAKRSKNGQARTPETSQPRRNFMLIEGEAQES